MTAKEYYEILNNKISDLSDIINNVVKAMFGTPGSKGVLVRLARIEIQLKGLFIVSLAIAGMLIKLIWFNKV